MLFHPHEKRFGLQGAIPKNKARLARSLGRTVGERLLTPDDLLGELTRSGLREALDANVARFINDVLETERGTLSELLPPDTLASVQSAISELSATVASQADAYLESEEFTTRVDAFVRRARTELASRPIGTLLTEQHRDSIAGTASRWAEEFSRSAELEGAIRDYLDRHANRLLSSAEPMVRRIPTSVMQATEKALESYLPLAAGRLGAFLANPTSRERIRNALHSLFRRLLRDLEFHQRLIARLVVTERTFDRALDTLETEGVDQLATLLGEEEVRAELALVLREGIMNLLERPLSSVIGNAGSERANAIVTTAGDYLLRVLRDERTHTFLAARIRQILESAESKSVADVMAGVQNDEVVRWVTAAARSDRARQFLRDGLRAAMERVLKTRIGRPARWLPADASSRLAATVAPAIWDWLRAQLPQLIARLDLESMVERKVLGFSTTRMEEIIRGVTERELKLIVRLGYLLGAFIGMLTFAISMSFRG
jgi:uncharacterized membrane protein YheB (UPF0754 family)